MKAGQKSVRGGIEDILIPMENFRCTQGDFEGNHPYYACDMAGKDGGREAAYFPFSAVCKATNPNDGNAVWWESQNKVRFADGTIDYATIMILHDNDLSGIYVGAKYPQGHQMAVEGNKMGTTYGKIGNHLHFEIAKGKFTTKYAKNNKGYYLPNGQPIEKCCFADGTNFLSSQNWAWKYTKDVPVAPAPAPSPSGADQIIKAGSKVKFDGIFKVDILKSPISSNLFGCCQLTGCSYNDYYNEKVKAYHWLPCGPFVECDANGNPTKDQVFTGGSSLCKNDTVYTVKEVDIPTDSAKINIDGRDIWVFCKYLYEVSNS